MNGSESEPTRVERESQLRARHAALLEYMRSCVRECDWHAVSDAANDLRCVETEMRAFGLSKP